MGQYPTFQERPELILDELWNGTITRFLRGEKVFQFSGHYTIQHARFGIPGDVLEGRTAHEVRTRTKVS